MTETASLGADSQPLAVTGLNGFPASYSGTEGDPYPRSSRDPRSIERRRLTHVPYRDRRHDFQESPTHDYGGPGCKGRSSLTQSWDFPRFVRWISLSSSSPKRKGPKDEGVLRRTLFQGPKGLTFSSFAHSEVLGQND